jgi:hypothetical protein
VTATDPDLMQNMRDGATTGLVLQALTAAGADPVADLHEGLYGPSVAVFGGNGTYRYLLTRRWKPGPVLPWLMLNPSKAGAVVNDPTVVKCVNFAAAIGYGGIAILNLFALVATDPAGIRTHPDPVGPGNDACLTAFFQPGDTVVAAWGADGARSGRAAGVTQALTAAGVRFLCLGVTANGQPRHPGRLAYSTPLTAWEPA